MTERELTDYLNQNEPNEQARSFVFALYRGNRDYWQSVDKTPFNAVLAAFHAGMKAAGSKAADA